ncbi:unnamed protein product [Calypogeia fissa]
MQPAKARRSCLDILLDHPCNHASLVGASQFTLLGIVDYWTDDGRTARPGGGGLFRPGGTEGGGGCGGLGVGAKLKPT